MGNVRLTRFLAQSLRLFVEDKPALQRNGGGAQGGGEDIPSARYAVSALSQLSFLHDSDESLLTLMPPDLQLPSLLEAFGSSSKDVGDDARLQAHSLAKRLVPKAVDDSVPSPQTPSMPTTSHQLKHVITLSSRPGLTQLLCPMSTDKWFVQPFVAFGLSIFEAYIAPGITLTLRSRGKGLLLFRRLWTHTDRAWMPIL
jgi:hypothetical protein